MASSENENEDIYRKILQGCGLNVDMKELADGDSTVIGERGVTLSGGQKARLSLARAAYYALVVARENAIVVMDDVLSALDVRSFQSFSHCHVFQSFSHYHVFQLRQKNMTLVSLTHTEKSLRTQVHTAKQIFDEVIVKLLGNTTRILVTHATHYVSQCDSIALVHHSTCTSIGHFNTLKQGTYREKLAKKLSDDEIREVEREIESLLRTYRFRKSV